MQIGMTLQFAQKAYCVLQAIQYRTCGLTILSDRSIQKLRSLQLWKKRNIHGNWKDLQEFFKKTKTTDLNQAQLKNPSIVHLA